ncbi:hypothetical protein BGZ68_005007 [Mortierella alpina]|nr:hypothetical protein BGZ68_005007 [Mortierella alpina]
MKSKNRRSNSCSSTGRKAVVKDYPGAQKPPSSSSQLQLRFPFRLRHGHDESSPRCQQSHSPEPLFDSPVFLDMDLMDMEVDNTSVKGGPAHVSDMLCAMDLDAPSERLEEDPDPTLLIEYQAEIFAYKRHMEAS